MGQPELLHEDENPRAFVPNVRHCSTRKGQYHLTKIQADKAWDTTTGSPSVVMAMTDDGVLDTHPDLAAANLWVNPNYSTNAATSVGGKYGITSYADPSTKDYQYTLPAPDVPFHHDQPGQPRG